MVNCSSGGHNTGHASKILQVVSSREAGSALPGTYHLQENDMSLSHRRQFLADVGRGMLAAGVGSTLAQDLGLATSPLRRRTMAGD